MPEESITTAQVIARVLREEGVEYAFGIGGETVLPLMLAMSELGIKIVHTRHEQAAAFAADAYARASRKLGVCFLFSGPGYTNASNGIAQAYYCKSPLLAIVGQHSTLVENKGPESASYAVQSCQAITKWSAHVVEDRLAAFMTRQALTQATSYPPGSVLLEIPENLMVRKRPSPEQRWYRPHPLTSPPSSGADPQAVAQAVTRLLQAERPVVVAGEQVYWDNAASELKELIELLQCPVVTRRLARGAVPETHPLAFGGRIRGAMLRQADLAFLIGLNLGYLEDYGRWGRQSRFIQLHHREQDIDQGIHTELALLGNAKTVLRQMIDWAQSRLKEPPRRGDWLEVLASLKQAEEERLGQEAENNRSARPIHPTYLAKEILDVVDNDATLVFDAYTGSAFLTERIKAQFPGLILDGGEWTTIGHGVGMGIGAQLARPGKQVLVLMGDGGMGIGGWDIETAVRCRLPVVYVINNNSSWSSGVVDLFFGDSFLLPDGKKGNPFLLTPMRFDKVFEPFGCYTERVEDPAQIRPALERAFASGKTAVLDVVVDRKVLHPMLLRAGPAHRWLGPEKMPQPGQHLAFPELFPKKPKAE